MKKFFLKSFAIGVVVIGTIAGIYSLSAPGTSSGSLWNLRSGQNGQKLTEQNRESLLTYVETLNETVNTLSTKVTTLETKGGGDSSGSGMEKLRDQIPLGTIIAVKGDVVNKSTMNANGWALCDGSTVSSQVSNADISGSTPNLQGKTLVGAGTLDSATFVAGNSYYTLGGSSYYGEVRHTLTVSEMPSHSHTITDPGHTHELIQLSRNATEGDYHIEDDSGKGRPRSAEVKSARTNITINNAGGGYAHNNMSPFYVVQYYIKVKNQSTTTPVASATPTYTYARFTSSYGGCSVSCGGGTQTRTVTCKRSDGTVMSDSFCTSTKPSTSTTCNTHSCGELVDEDRLLPGGGCFIAGTQILMADGSLKAIETIITGDQLIGADGSIHTVLIPLKIKWANRPLYAINDSAYFVTDSHPFMTTEGWKAIDVGAAKRENPELDINELVVGDVLITLEGQQLVETISVQTRPWTSFVYNFVTDGDHTYYADGYLVHNLPDLETKLVDAQM